MSNTEIQQQLERLAARWPGESVVADVVSRLPDPPARPARSPKVDFRWYSWIGGVATVMVFAASLWISLPRSMQSAFQDSLRGASSWHAMKEVFSDGETIIGEVWYDRDRGFRMEGMGQVTLDDGNVSHSWFLDSDSTTVLKRPSMDGVAMTAKMVDVSQIPSDWKKQRSQDHDREVNGVACRAFVVDIPNQLVASGDDHRSIMLMDNSDRLCQLINQKRHQDSWQLESRMTIDYGRVIPESTFQLDFPGDSKIVDVQTILDERFPISKALARGEKDGILFAVHDLAPIDDGSYYVISSVRGTPDYLRQYPPERRLVNLNYTALDVVSQVGSHSSIDGGTQVMMYAIQWQGVDYLWWIMTLRNQGLGTAPGYDSRTGEVRVPLIGNHRHKDRRDHRGVQLQTRLTLNVPSTDRKPTSLEEVVAIARADMQIASHVLGEFESLPIAGAAENNTVVFTSFDKVTDAGYARELRKARWQTQNGNFSGDGLPDGIELAVANPVESVNQSPRVESQQQANRIELSHEPTPLPATISGRVVDSENRPIAGAKATVRIRRFRMNKDFDEDAGPGPWSATTNQQGVYSIAPTGTVIPASDEVRIDVVAGGYAQVSEYDYEKELVKGSLPEVKLPRGRTITGRLIDTTGKQVDAATVRFQHNTEAMIDTWDSGPFAVGRDGKFSVSIPTDGKAVGVVYPKEFAPRFINVSTASDQGDIRLEPGVRLRGRVLDRSGKGVADTVVGFMNTELTEMHGYIAVIGSAVKTDSKGYFQLPPLRGTYELTVSKSAPDYSRQMMLVGNQPPPIDAKEIDFDAADTSQLVILQE
ncbi:MAG: carboxypeptidase regulatory-like domain-containing protein [Planctomycetales bacterium]|nr:carboxypeptidase regulatory-like domain-containing protein [Planctomycetales bacterium]